MKIITEQIEKDTKGAGDLLDITSEVTSCLNSSGLNQGILTVFVVGSTAAITSFEYEPGMIEDMQEIYEKIAPQDKHYHHDDTWNDANGFSHVRAALQGPSLTIPFDKGRLFLGTWQQVVLAEFDNRPRHRQIIVQIMGE